jgi:hypothetical protein
MESRVKKAKCEAIELQKQLEQLNVRVKTFEHRNELVGQQETLLSRLLKM